MPGGHRKTRQEDLLSVKVEGAKWSWINKKQSELKQGQKELLTCFIQI